MASDHIPPQQLREFIFQEICEHLTPKEVKHLAYTQNLPAPYLDKDGTEVLLKLELLETFSECNLEPLARMMRVIGRKDLAKKVEKHLKKQKGSKKARDIPVDEHTLKQCQIAAGLKIAKLQSKMLLEQIEEVHTTAQDLGHRRLEEELMDAISIIEQQLQSKLSQASVALSMRQTSTESDQISRHSSLTSSGSDESREVQVGSPEVVPHRSRSDAISKPKGKSSSLPKDILMKQSQATPSSEDEPEYEYVEHTPLEGMRPAPAPATSLYYDSKEIVPQNRQDESQGRLVVGRDGTAQGKQKPKIAPKPTKKLVSSANSPSSSPTVPAPIANYTGGSADYTGGSADTSAGDSGFVDARKYRKDSPPPKVIPRHKYTPLQAEQREAAAYYAATNPNTTKDVVYDDVEYSEDNPYVNIDLMGRLNSK